MLRPDGPLKAVARAERQLKGHALIAVGVWPAGPWRLAITADPPEMVKKLGQGNWDHLTGGALLWFEALTWAETARDAAAAALGAGTALKVPWFAAWADDVQRALGDAARAVNAPAFYDHAAWVARIERKVEQEIGTWNL